MGSQGQASGLLPDGAKLRLEPKVGGPQSRAAPWPCPASGRAVGSSGPIFRGMGCSSFCLLFLGLLPCPSVLHSSFQGLEAMMP